MAQKNNPGAEEIFSKAEEDMTDIERMMADILAFDASENIKTEDPVPETEEPSASTGYSPEPPAKRKRTPESNGSPKAKDAADITGENNAEPAASYSRSAREAREKEIDTEVRKRSSRPGIVILVLCALLVVGVLVYKNMFDDIRAGRLAQQAALETPTPIIADVATEAEIAEMAQVSFPPDMVIPTPEPEGEEEIKITPPDSMVVIISETEEKQEGETETGGQDSSGGNHSYEIYKEDISWTAAQQKCIERGGYLMVISSQEEFDQAVALASQYGINNLWVGCHRENGQLIWENGETVDFYVWDRGEPSAYDSGDKVSEDYLLLWKHGNGWYYNDSRNDPAADYPVMYGGTMGYICEYN